MNKNKWYDNVLLLQKLKVENIFTNYPFYIAHNFKKLFEQQNAPTFYEEIIKLSEIVIHYITFYLVSYYIHLLKNDQKFNANYDVLTLIRNAIERMNSGDMLKVKRGIVKHLIKENSKCPFEDYYLSLNNNKLNQTLDRLVNIRNKKTHGRLFLNVENSFEIGKELVDLISTVFLKTNHIFLLDIIVPIDNGYDNNYEVLVFKGAYQNPYYKILSVDDKITKDLIIDKVYLKGPNNEFFIELDPFWVFTRHPQSMGKRLFLCQYEKKDSPVYLTDFQSNPFCCEETRCNYENTLDILSPDFRYQRDPYKRGHNLLIVKHTIKLFVINYHGDLRTQHKLIIKKIKDDSGNIIGQDVINFDYHDAPEYPIPDEIFDLKVEDSKGNNLPVLYNIHNDGFRDFKVGLNRRLSYNEEETIYLSCFEPMLMNGFFLDNYDYYDFNFTEPTEILEIFMYLPKGVYVNTLLLKYFKDNKQVNSKTWSSEIKKDNQGNDMIYACIKKPPLDESLILTCEVSLSDNLTIPDMSVKNKFYAGFYANVKINQSPFNKWLTKQRKDGTIEIKPIIENNNCYHNSHKK